MSPLPFSIRLFLAEGSPSGLRLIEKSNWNGQGFVCPRPRFSWVKNRNEFGKAGVYVLMGPSEGSDFLSAYIGEADPLRDRLVKHHSDRDFWTIVIGFVSKDANLNKAHIQYLEFRLIELAKAANRCRLQNINDPTEPSLSEVDRADAEGFLQEVLLCLPVLGINIFEIPEPKSAPKQLFFLKNKGISAQGYESTDGFVVKKESTAVYDIADSAPPNSLVIRKDFIERGILVPSMVSGYLRLTQDYEFSSPSIAAGTLIGASINGREAWRTADGVSLKHLQETQRL